MDRFFIQVPRHVPRFKNLIKTSYYYIRLQESQDSLLNPIRTPPGCLPQVVTPDARVPTDGYWDLNSNKQKTEAKIKTRDQKIEAHGIQFTPFSLLLQFFTTDDNKQHPQFQQKTNKMGKKDKLEWRPSTRPCLTRQTVQPSSQCKSHDAGATSPTAQQLSQ